VACINKWNSPKLFLFYFFEYEKRYMMFVLDSVKQINIKCHHMEIIQCDLF